MIIIFAGTKGGPGKSTIAMNMAAIAAANGQDTLLLDLDPEQESSYKWAGRRSTEWPTAPVVHREQASGGVIDIVRERAKRYKHIIIDAGGYDSDAMRTALAVSQRAYFPLRPGPLDIESVPRIINMVDIIRSTNTNLKSYFIISQAATNQKTEEMETREYLEEVQGYTLLNQTIFIRKAYRDAALEGLSVIEMDDVKAKEEMESLYSEIFGTTKNKGKRELVGEDI